MTTLDWPEHAAVVPEVRAQIDATYMRTRRESEGGAGSASDDRLAALERRLVVLERAVGPNGQALLEEVALGVGAILAQVRKEIADVAGGRRKDQVTVNAMVKGMVAAELREAGALTYAGIWRAPVSYTINAVVTHAGGLWLGVAGSSGVRPGHGSAGVWKLICKSGGAV